MARISWLGGVVAVWMIGGCFKPAIEREVVDDGEVEVEDTSEVEDTIEVEVDAGDGADTAEVDAAETVGCEGANGLPCDDGDPCTRDDRCGSGGCEGIPYVCDDGSSCTEDQCDGVGGCNYPVVGGACLIGGACFAAGQVKADDPCRVCAGGQAWSPNDGGACEDGDEVCTVGDRCEGLVCVGGPRPSDAATDWALRPLLTTTPSTSQVLAVGRSFLDPVFLVRATGASMLPAVGGDRVLAGQSVALVRRASSGLVPLLVMDGFTNLRVTASAPNLIGSTFALAARFDGAGTIEGQSSGPEVISGGGNLLIEVDTNSGLAWKRETHHEVDALSHRMPDGLVVGYAFTQDFEVPHQPGVIFSNVRDEARWFEDLAVVSASRDGSSSWAAHIGTKDFLGSSSLCSTPSGGVVVSTAFTEEVTIKHGTATSTVSSTSPFATYLVVWFDSNGAIRATKVPFDFGTDPEANQTILGGMPLVSCSETEASLILPGYVGEGVGGVWRVEASSGSGATLVRLRVDGGLTSDIIFQGATPTASVTLGDELLLGWISGNGGSIEDRSGRVVVVHSNPMWSGAGLARFDASGNLKWVHSVARDSALFVSGLSQIPSRGIFFGGASLFVDTTITGIDSEFVLPSTSDYSAFAAGLNTNRGLECEAMLP